MNNVNVVSPLLSQIEQLNKREDEIDQQRMKMRESLLPCKRRENNALKVMPSIFF